jgi:hypothetical protein
MVNTSSFQPPHRTPWLQIWFLRTPEVPTLGWGTYLGMPAALSYTVTIYVLDFSKENI